MNLFDRLSIWNAKRLDSRDFEQLSRFYNGLKSEELSEELEHFVMDENYDVEFYVRGSFNKDYFSGWASVELNKATMNGEGPSKVWHKVEVDFNKVKSKRLEEKLKEGIVAGKSLNEIEKSGDYRGWMQRVPRTEEKYEFDSNLEYECVGDVQDKIDRVIKVVEGDEFVSYFPVEKLEVFGTEKTVGDYLSDSQKYNSVEFSNFDIQRKEDGYEVRGKIVLSRKDGLVDYLPLESKF